MFKRLAASLSSPTKVVNYINDKWYYPLLYLLIISIIYIIPVSYYANNTNILSYDMQSNIKNSLVNSEEINYIIQNGELIYLGEGSNITTVDTQYARLIFTNDIVSSKSLNDNLNLIIKESKIIIVYMNLSVSEIELKEFNGFNELDFRLAKTADKDFYNHLFSALDEFFNEYKPTFVSALIVYNISYLLVEILFLALVMGFVMKMQTKLPFKRIFKLSLYITFPAFIGMFFTILFSIAIFNYLGMLVSFYFSYRVSNVLLKRGGIRNV